MYSIIQNLWLVTITTAAAMQIAQHNDILTLV